jgi:hypothetical protein
MGSRKNKIAVSDKEDTGSSKGSELLGAFKSIVVVVITGAVAAGMTHYYKMQEESFAVSAEARKTATDTYYDIIETIGKRHYYALRAAIGFQWQDDEMVRWQQYDNMVMYWNEHRYRILALTGRYFGESTEDQLRRLTPEFEAINDKLLAAKNAFREKKRMPEDFNQKGGLFDQLYELDNEINRFSDTLQAQLKNGKVDIYSPQPPLEKP